MSQADLLAIIAQQRSELRNLTATVMRLEHTVHRLQKANERHIKEKKQLRARIEELERSEKRQACPFSKGKRKLDPKRPGRKVGAAHGPTNSRAAAPEIHRRLRAVAPKSCPGCGGHVEVDRQAKQVQWDIPRVEPVVTEFTIDVGHCVGCRKRIQGRHPEQTSDALGAASFQIGPNVIALSTHLNRIMGGSYDKVAAFLKQSFNFDVQPSTLVRALQRMARRMDPAYSAIQEIVRTSPAVYPDETGYRVGGRSAWLWVFVAGSAVLYRVAPGRGYDVAKSALGEDYAGFLGHDGLGVYDRFDYAIHQTCLRHLMVRCRDLLAVATRRAVSFPRVLLEILKRAFVVRDAILAGELTPAQERTAVLRLNEDLDHVLGMRLSHAPNRRLADHIRNHRDEVFTFVEHPGQVEGANWPAEQEIRPSVILRKLSGCNKTWKGAHVHEVLMTVIRTAVRRGMRRLDYLVDCLRKPANEVWMPGFLAGT